ncbi:hypothetical protein [Agrobacterium vitis]|uniref:hypothetical protein n=1 Tax=Agrobacterium vitis TaxID=373 RepID=UPI0018D21321|nr:hypothetical protein [Agrobacterium vitis]
MVNSKRPAKADALIEDSAIIVIQIPRSNPDDSPRFNLPIFPSKRSVKIATLGIYRRVAEALSRGSAFHRNINGRLTIRLPSA